MSEYDSSSEGSEEGEKQEQYFRVFQQDFYLSGSLPLIQDWKQSIKESLAKQNNEIDPFKYMELEVKIFQNQENYLLAGYHIRYYAFANYFSKALDSLTKDYHRVYMAEQGPNQKQVQRLDETLTKLTFYLQKIQLSRAESYITEINKDLLNQIYEQLQFIFPYILSPYCIWRLVMFLQLMNEEFNYYVMSIPVDMTLEYYKKTFKTLKFKHKQLTAIATLITPDIQKENFKGAFFTAVKEICKYQKASDNQERMGTELVCEFMCCLRYMYFGTDKSMKKQTNLYLEYIMASLKIPHYGKNQNMPVQYYEKLFLRVLNSFRTQPEIIDLGLYLDPNSVGERSKESFGKIQAIVLKLCQEVSHAQNSFLESKTQPTLQYIKKLLKNEQFTLLIQFLQTIMQFNKSAFLKADNQIYETFLDMAEFLKNAFLSFGKDLWLFPQNIFTPLTLGFFKKISQDINDDLKNMLYQMVENLNNQKLPQKLTFENGEFKLKNVTRLEYLSAIMYYIEDCSRQEQYLNLPQIAPANLETSILMVKSLHVKLKHHEPNPAQMPLFIEYLKECQKYKLNINFRWYKNQNYLSKTSQRQTQFQIESSLPCKQAKQLFRKCLNYRDRQYARKIIEEDYNQNHLINAVELAAMIKYNHGIQDLPNIQNIREEEIFLLLEQMNTMLAILPDDLFDLPLEQEINVSYLHILLTFYCSKIKEAKGSDIYLMILQKILINYLKSSFDRSKQFKKKYPKFFERFIYQYHQIEICATLNDLLMEFQDKYLPFSKDETQWTTEQKSAVNDLKEKIQIIREQFLDKLEGSQEQIAMFMVTFTSLISQALPFVVFIECVRLFVKLIIKKKSLGQITSLNIFLTDQTYHQPKFIQKMLTYFQNAFTGETSQNKDVKSYLLRHLLKSEELLNVVTFKELMQILHQVKLLLDVTEDTDDLNDFYRTMKNIVMEKPQKIRPEWILCFVLLFYQQELQHIEDFNMFDEEPDKHRKDKSQKTQVVLNVLKSFQTNEQFWSQVKANLKDFKFKDFNFLFRFTDELRDLMKVKLDYVSFKDIWLYFLKKLNDPSWTFYYMLKLNDPTLINIHENRDDVLIYLIKKEKLTKQSYPIFKNMISETKNMPVILEKIMKSYNQEQNYVQNYQFHNKLILINERFPDTKIQETILKWIQMGQNKLPLRIPQSYYINFLKSKLKSLPQNIAIDQILTVHKGPEKLQKLNKDVQKIFEVLLYFPIKKFQSISLSKGKEQKPAKIEEKEEKSEEMIEADTQFNEPGNEDDWEQQNQDEQVEIKKTKDQSEKQRKKSQSLNQEEDSHSESGHNDDNENQDNEQNSNDQNNNYYDQRPEFLLQIFYDQTKKDNLKIYKNVCNLRQEIDIYLKSDYEKLRNSPIMDNEYLHNKILLLIKELEILGDDRAKLISMHFPLPLYEVLRKFGFSKERDEEKIKKLRKPKNKIFHLQRDLFSERAQSDGSDVEAQDNYSSEYDQSQDDQGDYDDDNQDENNQLKEQPQKQNKKREKQDQQDDIELPELTTQFSKIQSEIKGSQLDRRELIKILEIFLVQIFKLTPINFKKNEIVFSYVEIMESDLSQVFFESILTILRMDQNHKKNRKTMLEEMKNKLTNTKSKFQIEEICGFPEFSKYNGLVNFTYLLKVLKEKDKYPANQNNPFRKESGTILPIAQKFLIEFDLPLQSNVFSLVLLYIHSKNKIRDLIEQIAVSYQEDGLKMTKKQIKRISEAFLKEKSHYSAWSFIEQNINYRVNDTERLIISLDSYSQEVFKALTSSAQRVKQTIEKNNQIFDKKLSSQTEIKSGNTNHIKHYQRLYYITSNLLSSCSQQIKQFYFMNKHTCRYLWQDDDQNDDNYNYNKIPKKLAKCKSDIYTNQSFVLLVELAFRVIYFVKKQLYGKISSKKFSRLIHYPKLVIQTATLYMHLSGEKGTKEKWSFNSKSTVEKFIDNYQMGEYKFKNLVEVYNLILGLLEIQSFCTGKFKELLIPYFTKNREIGIDAPLMFKVPQIDESVDGQNIFVTRECSFDMAFYQVNGEGLFVEFYEEEGSDHGGMIRQLMMGWKGVGVGQEDFFIGKILGISFRQSVPYGGYVDIEMCIRITNYEVTMENIQELDKDIFNSLKFIKQNDPADLALTFSVMKNNPQSFQIEQFNLKPNGSQIPVTQQNKEEYIKLYLQKYYKVGREHQLEQIATGFYTVACSTYVSIFKPHQLMQHLKGQQVCDVNVLKAHVKYVEGYTETSVIIKWLWEILESYNQEQLNKFIQFLTGSPKLPIFNPNFEITIERVFNVNNLPVAHTCFNTLDLPQYPTKDILEKNLLTAIFEGNDNFGIM